MSDWYLPPDGQRMAGYNRDPSNPYAVSIFSPVSTNTKGTWAQIIASTPFNANRLMVNIIFAYFSYEYLMDVGIGPSGSEVVLVSNLYRPALSSYYGGMSYDLPIQIPAGVRVAARVQCSGYSAGLTRVAPMFYLIGGSYLGQELYGKMIDYGTNLTNTSGTLITPGTGGLGSWTQITSGCTSLIKGLVICITGGLSSLYDFVLDIGIGSSGSEVVLIPQWGFGNCNYDIYPRVSPIIPVNIPVGTRIAARAYSETSSQIGVILYAFS